jgi:ATP-binding cassette subfamily C protein
MQIDIERLVANPDRSTTRAVLEPLLLIPLGQRVAVTIGLVVSRVIEMIGLATIVPLLATVSFGNDTNFHIGGMKSLINKTFSAVLSKVGLSADFATLVLVVVFALTIKSAISIAVMRYIGDLMAEITKSVRMEVVRLLLNAKWGYFSAQPMARLISGAGAETGSVGESFLCSANILSSCIQVAAYLAVCALISWRLSIVAVIIGIVMFGTFGKLIRMSRQASKLHSRQLRQMSASFTDTILGMKPIKAMGRQARFTALFEVDAQKLHKAMRAKIVSSEFASELQEPIVAGLLCFGLYLATTEWHLRLHEQVVVGLILIRLVSTFSQIQTIYHRLTSIYDMYRSVGTLIKEAMDAAEPATGTRTPTLKKGIEFRHVTFGYGVDKIIFRDLNWTLKAGQITALIGQSGAGKSTIVDLLIGLREPGIGTVLLDQINMKAINLVQWRHMIGYVPQEVILFNDSIFNNVTLREPEFTEQAVIDALNAAGAMSFVGTYEQGVHYPVGERGHHLSGGQRQRIAIARALVRNPTLLILDEATAGLDKDTERGICDSIVDIARARNLTVISISHHAIWTDIADQVYVVSKGHVTLLHDRTGTSYGELSSAPVGSTH